MSRKYNIRWKQDDLKELQRVVKNFNAKITRLEKKDPNIKNALPDRVSAAQLRDMIETRQDLNRELNMLRRFSERGAEEIVVAPDNYYNTTMTKWQRTEMNRMAANINRVRANRKKKLEQFEVTDRGQKTGYTVGDVGMGSTGTNALNPVNAFTKFQSRADIRHRFEQLKRESQSQYWSKRDEGLRQSYVRSIEDHFLPDDVEGVLEAINNMDFNEFYKRFQSENAGFDATYPPRPGSPKYNAFLDGLKAMWTPNDLPPIEELPFE